jgi:hypothetical protein
MSELYEMCLQKLQEKINTSGVSKEEFEFADKITEIADDVAFDFSLGDDSTGEVSVFAKHDSKEKTIIEFKIEKGAISMNPWPLSTDYFKSSIKGYSKENYPERLEEQEVEFIINKNT